MGRYFCFLRKRARFFYHDDELFPGGVIFFHGRLITILFDVNHEN
ncbi:hypothetical protein D083_0671 [Dickeya solani RNS 08.23.3.1.A]|nr:hypothetical protein D083_0671 [Dickeya solani RNS 08.23.3.1.A]